MPSAKRGVAPGELTAAIVRFVRDVVSAMGLALELQVEELPDGVRINLGGAESDTLLRRKAEPLQALQHLVTVAFRDQLDKDRRVVIDCCGYRRDKDAELRQMAYFLAGRAKSTGVAQELGPLNPYERRIVHVTVAEDAAVTSESIGDAFLKTVVISPRKS